MRHYLDHNATSPLRPEAREALDAALSATGNPSSVHREGQKMRAAIEQARAETAEAFGVEPACVVFTSGASEAAALALSSDIRANGASRPANGLLVSAVEHPCVLAGGRFAIDRVNRVEVDGSGLLDLGKLERRLQAAASRGERTMVALMLANNETGVVQPVAEAARLVRAHGGYLVCDAVQAVGRVAVDIATIGADMLIVSSHKIGGPPGCGALVLADPAVAPAPVLTGGGQERGLRAGTENAAAISGFAAALRAAVASVEPEAVRLDRLRSDLEAAIAEVTPGAVVVAADAPRLANTAAICLPGVAAETLVIALDLEGMAVSAGAACSSGKVGRSHVLDAMGWDRESSGSVVRVSLGWSSGDADVAAFAAAWKNVTSKVAARAAA